MIKKIVVAVVLIGVLAAGGFTLLEEQGKRRPVPDGKGDPGGSARCGDRNRNGECGDHRPRGHPGFGDGQGALRGFQLPGEKGAAPGPDRSGAFRGAGWRRPRPIFRPPRPTCKRRRSPCRTPTRTLERNRTLFAKNYIARSDLDTAETNQLSALGPTERRKGAGGAEQGGAAAGRDQSALHPHPLAGGRGRHLPERGYRADRGRELPDARRSSASPRI